MMIYRTMTAEEQSDTELVSRCLAGDRDAFSHIVSRYQTLPTNRRRAMAPTRFGMQIWHKQSSLK
jgi:hypothetical protein